MKNQKTKPLKRVLIMAGGTGGHVFPGLTVANYLRDNAIDVHWLGTSRGLEARLVPEANIPLHLISVRGLRGKGVRPLLTAPFSITSAVFKAGQIISKLKPDAVIGMGGFVSGPGGAASWLLGYPLIIHEQNAKAGTTNKILMHFAKKVLEGFPDTFKPQSKILNIGNPVRPEIENLPPSRERLSAHKPFHLLVLGGSLGAKALNEVVPLALSQLSVTERPLIMHQTGENHYEHTKKLYESSGLCAEIKPFIKNMSAAYAWADVVLCRAGGLTVAELCAVGLGAIFIPFPYAIDDHQTANANYMVKNNAALCIQEKELTENRLAELIGQLSKFPEKRLQMAYAAYELRKLKVSEKIFDIISVLIN